MEHDRVELIIFCDLCVLGGRLLFPNMQFRVAHQGSCETGVRRKEDD